MTDIITRFAPSPTGSMHFGNLRTALINFLYAKKYAGNFVLRIDDTDQERNIDKADQEILNTLSWLGIEFDDIYYQSKRVDLYKTSINFLKDSHLIYPCYETQEELEVLRKENIKKGKPPIYNRQALQLSKDQMREYQDKGILPYYRFYLGEDVEVSWNDLIKGPILINVNSLSDPVVVKKNGQITYLLASVIDDIDMKISDIIRGEDHLTNTAMQSVMFDCLTKKNHNLDI